MDVMILTFQSSRYVQVRKHAQMNMKIMVFAGCLWFVFNIMRHDQCAPLFDWRAAF